VNDEEPTIEHVIDQLAQRRADALGTLEMLRAQRTRIEQDAALLEHPQAVLEYLDFFIGAIDEVVVECARIADELPQRVTREQIDMLREIAANCRIEQRRCLAFRDKSINRPLPHERMRPLLNDISVTTRDQLTAFFDLNNAAARLEQLVSTPEPPADPRRTLGRRQLFTGITSLFKLPKDL
jgi:hypothetical protein